MRMNRWVVAESGEPLHKIIVDLRAGCSVADDETLAGKIVPANLVFRDEPMSAWQNHEDSFRPKMFGLTIVPRRRSRDEGDIQSKLTHSQDVLCWIAVDQFDENARMLFVVCSQQLEQEARRQR